MGYTIKKFKDKVNIKTYDDALSSFISTWVLRLVVLLENGIAIKSHLTGGADSRTVFTILKKAIDISERIDTPPIYFSSTSDKSTPQALPTSRITALAFNFPKVII